MARRPCSASLAQTSQHIIRKLQGCVAVAGGRRCRAVVTSGHRSKAGLYVHTDLILAFAHRGCICVEIHPRAPGRWGSSATKMPLCLRNHLSSPSDLAQLWLRPWTGHKEGGEGLGGSGFHRAAETKPDSGLKERREVGRLGMNFPINWKK